jgi:hypothetical protein
VLFHYVAMLLVRWFVSSRAVFCCSGRSLVEIFEDATRFTQVASWQYGRGIRLSSRLCDLLDLRLVGGTALGLLILEFGHLVVVVIVITVVAHATHAAHH